MYATKHDYWSAMIDRSASNLSKVAEDHIPETEHEVKELLADVMKHGTCKEAAEAIVEATEFMIAHHALKDLEMVK